MTRGAAISFSAFLLTLLVTAVCRPPPPSSPAPADTALHAEVEQTLQSAPDLLADTIQVQVTDGEVHLSGWVRTLEEKERAHQMVAGVEGVREVSSVALDVQ